MVVEPRNQNDAYAPTIGQGGPERTLEVSGMNPGMKPHKDGDPDKTKEEYDQDNHSDQENPNNDEYDK